MKGGVRWKQGSDACVFKPNVACREDPIAFPRNMPNMISRIIPISEKDVEIEETIKTNFPQLVKRGIVVVNTKVCTPQYIPDNLKRAPNLAPLGGSSHISHSSYNLITPEYTDHFFNFLKASHGGIQIGLPRALELLRGAICAAIELVPDSGVWVIHGDLHMGNILVKRDTSAKTSELALYTALADWGRAIVFNKDSQVSIHDGLTNYLSNLSRKFGPFATYRDLASHPTMRTGEFPQFSIRVLMAIHEYYEELRVNHTSVDKFTKAMNAMRGWMVYSLLKGVYFFYKTALPASSNELLQATDQAHLISIVNAMMPSMGGEPYYTKRYVLTTSNSGPPASLAPAGAGPAAAGAGAHGGKRKSRKQRRRESRKKKRV